MSVTYGEILDLPAGLYFRNVNGSEQDPHLCRYPSWIGLWRQKTGESGSYCCSCGSQRGIKGGHIILGRQGDPQAAENDDTLEGGYRVFLAPICEVCNGQNRPLLVNFGTKILQLCEYKCESSNPYVHEPVQRRGHVDDDDRSYLRSAGSAGSSSIAVPSPASSVSAPSRHSTRSHTGGWGGWGPNPYGNGAFEQTYDSQNDFTDDGSDSDYMPGWG